MSGGCYSNVLNKLARWFKIFSRHPTNIGSFYEIHYTNIQHTLAGNFIKKFKTTGECVSNVLKKLKCFCKMFRRHSTDID